MRLTYLVSHPIQYQAPLLQRIARESDIDFKVIFERGRAAGPRHDPGFQRDIQWDIPLTDGYDNVDLAETDLHREVHAADALWVHGWQTRTIRRAIALAHRAGVPVLMRGENNDIAMPDRGLVRRMVKRAYLNHVFRRCTVFLTIGSENAKYYLDRGVPNERLFLTPYAIDNDRFAAAAREASRNRREFRSRLGLAEDRPVVLFVGKLLRRKRPELLARAFRQAAFAGAEPALVFVGGGEMEGMLRDLAPDAHFPGFQNQSALPAFYDLADVLVLPSEREPWGLVVNEAMACGTAVVTSDQVGCASDLVTEDCGMVFPSGNADALAAALVRCLGHGVAMGRAAQKAIEAWSYEADVRGLRQALDHVEQSRGKS